MKVTTIPKIKNGWERLAEMTREQLETALMRIIKVMHYDENGEVVDSERQWDSDTPVDVNEVLRDYGLEPE